MLGDAEAVIRRLIQQELVYFGVYTGQVVSPAPGPPTSGAVLVQIGDLGHTNPAQGIIAFPDILNRGFTFPQPGSLVRVYFEAGDKDKARYFAVDSESLPPNGMPSAFNGLPTTHVVFESVLKQSIVIDDVTQLIKLKPNLGVHLGLAVNSMVLGEILAAFLTTIVGVFNAHTHPVAVPATPFAGATGTPAAAMPTPPANMLSIKNKLD